MAPQLAAIRAHRRRRHARRRWIVLANGRRVRPTRLYWSLFWYFNCAPAWKTSRHAR